MPVRGAAQEAPTLLDHLRGLGVAALTTLLEVRPDLAEPPPGSLSALASRAVTPASLDACRQALDLGAEQVYEALWLLPRPAAVEELAALLGTGADDADLAHALRRLGGRALVHRRGDRVSLLPAPEPYYPAGLGPPASVALAVQPATALAGVARRLGVKAGTTKTTTLAAIAEALAEPGRLARLLKDAPAGTADLARQLATEGPEGYQPGAAYSIDKERTPIGWLANRGFLAPRSWDTVVLVREVGLAMRDGKAFPDLALRAPELSVVEVDAAAADRAAAERALRLVADVVTILDGWAADPPRQLKAGGLGIQAVRRAAKAVDRTEVETARVIELAAAAGLVSIDFDTDAALPLPAYDGWADLDGARRWSYLVAGWMAWDLHVGLAGALDGKRKPIPPLLVRAPEPYARARRSRMLAALLAASPDTAVTAPSAFARATWDAPALWSGGPAMPTTLGAWTLVECDLLGLSGLGALSTWGRLAAAGDIEAAAAALGERLPAATSSFVVQADLTALAPAELVRSVQAELEAMADLESRGGATLYRFTEASVRRGFEGGRRADDILGFLDAHATRGVPQALTYLVNDVGRRFGQLRVAAIGCCLRSDDASLLAEVVASRAAKRLGLRLLAPTVAAASADAATVLKVVREAGFLPAEEGPAGELVISRPPRRRAVPDPRLSALGRRRPGATAGFGPAGGEPAASATGAASSMAAEVAARLVAAPAAVAPLSAKAFPPPRAVVPGPPPPGSPAPTPPPSLFEVGAARRRPDSIVRDPLGVVELLHEAMVEDWPVRLAYTNKEGRMTQLNVGVIDVDDRDAVVDLLSDWQSRVLAVRRIAWARVLTDAEEEALS
jgi:hypothetical protein